MALRPSQTKRQSNPVHGTFSVRCQKPRQYRLHMDDAGLTYPSQIYPDKRGLWISRLHPIHPTVPLVLNVFLTLARSPHIFLHSHPLNAKSEVVSPNNGSGRGSSLPDFLTSSQNGQNRSLLAST